jgi:hypothetical protein
MTKSKLLLACAVACIAAVATTGALAGGRKATAVTVINAVTKPPVMVPNRYIQDNLRWQKDVYTVPSGGSIKVVNLAADEGPHTFTVVQQKDEPKNGLQVARCKICEVLGKAHGANPNSDAPPKFPFLENGVGQQTPPQVDRPGDSGVTGRGKKGESITLTVTAPAGTKLYFMCLIHPWMQAELDVT